MFSCSMQSFKKITMSDQLVIFHFKLHLHKMMNNLEKLELNISPYKYYWFKGL